MKLLSLFVIIGLVTLQLNAQSDTPCGAPTLTVGAACTNTAGTTAGATQSTNAANGGSPTCGSMGPDVWYSFVAPASGNVSIQTTAGSITDGCMALYNGPCGSPTQISCDDDSGPGLMPQIAGSSLTPGATYYVRVWRYGGGTGTFSICITAVAASGSNTNCNTQTPICSGSPISFTANTGGTPASTVNPGNNYGCLFTSPNPSWYYLQIATGGNLVVDITAGSDVDFAIWGPFASQAAGNAACNSYGGPLDCSYSTAAVEQVNVAGVTPGQVYVLLVTNYANTVQTINVTNAGGTATTNCAILLPVGYSAYNAQQIEGKNYINWTTESEINNDYFLLERSETGINWEVITGVEGQGTTTTPHDYSYIDQRPFETGTYYRLKQVDTDGQSKYSNVLYVKTINESVLEMFPNPTSSGTFNLNVEATNLSDVRVIDTYGRTVEDFELEKSNTVKVSLGEEFKGIYLVQVTLKNGNVLRGKIELK